MSEKVIAQLCEQWQNTACKGMGDSFVDETEFLELTKETFRLLSSLDSNHVIPNSVARILVLMQEFAVYCWFSGKLRRLNMWMIVSHLLYNFLDGFEKSGSIYPKLKLTDGDNLDYFDFTTNTLVDILLWFDSINRSFKSVTLFDVATACR